MSTPASENIRNKSTSELNLLVFVVYLMSVPEKSAADEWMDKIINQKGKSRLPDPVATNNPYDELNRFFAEEPLSKQECPSIISWFGVSSTLFHKLFSFSTVM